MTCLGADIGASTITFVLSRKGRILEKEKIKVPETRQGIVRAFKERAFKAEKIGIGIPGPLNLERTLVLNPPNLKCLKNCPLARLVEKETGRKTLMENDGNCFALGEALFGAGKGKSIVLGITLGSGLGGGLVIGKKIYRGAFGSALESGHVTINYLGPKCSCGGKGCLEVYASRKFFARKGLEPEKAFLRAGKKDKKALKLFQEQGKYLGLGLANMINIVDPEVVVIGGGISGAYPYFIKSLKKEIEKQVISAYSKKYVRIKKAALGQLSGALGAAEL